MLPPRLKTLTLMVTNALTPNSSRIVGTQTGFSMSNWVVVHGNPQRSGTRANKKQKQKELPKADEAMQETQATWLETRELQLGMTESALHWLMI